MGGLLTADPSQDQHSRGIIFGVIAYGLWGMFPLYFALLRSVSAPEIVAHRVIWSFLFLIIILSFTKGWSGLWIALRSRGSVGLLAIAAVALSLNWLVYIYSVTTNQLVQGSLGYFINPLVSVALGVVLFRERLRVMQWSAIGLAVIAVVILTLSYGHLPWIGLTLAFSFASYGLIKKYVGFGAVDSLAIETAVLTPFAIILLLFMESTARGVFVQGGLSISTLLMLLGPVTAVPLLAFGAAATRIPLSMLGVLQYITPLCIFIFGVTVFHESMSPSRWLGFFFIWVALMIFSTDAIRNVRSSTRDQRQELLTVMEPD